MGRELQRESSVCDGGGGGSSQTDRKVGRQQRHKDKRGVQREVCNSLERFFFCVCVCGWVGGGGWGGRCQIDRQKGRQPTER